MLGRVGALLGSSVFAGAVTGDEHGTERTKSADRTGTKTTYEGILEGDTQRDTYTVEVTAGEGIEIEMTVQNLQPGQDARMTLVAPDGTEVGELPTDNPNRGAYATNAEEFPDLDSVVGGDVAEQTGHYCVRVTGIDASATESIEYTLSIETVALDRFDPNERREDATPFEASETVEGVITGYDHDWFAVEVDENDELTIDYEIVQEADLFDQALVLYTPDDETVEVDGSQATVRTTTGTYYLHIGPDDETTAADLLAKETYRLTINTGGEESEPSESTQTTNEDCKTDS
ncbi:hypothetical protein [Halalkalicoccus jeotgali]|uniref:Uncharacterized protein n=1 Tax=Halalkalicoccus jeotgali (strain DSM 18796 / CECT 7217 / JCM 14584 / KCTC 4019 / B3) TaxID=795797 RepID=D8JBD4_HALJB|nr:hypothetical protein [Halalkalicoccus jeotgali]ADJ16587.1 hypothetical protein HacjB3_16146 [Halalkalicoccus jeotgali B3]ELY41316.1 hypothetical protein C497_01100 [Halalkalicoccus jeotgali B3]